MYEDEEYKEYTSSLFLISRIHFKCILDTPFFDAPHSDTQMMSIRYSVVCRHTAILCIKMRSTKNTLDEEYQEYTGCYSAYSYIWG